MEAIISNDMPIFVKCVFKHIDRSIKLRHKAGEYLHFLSHKKWLNNIYEYDKYIFDEPELKKILGVDFILNDNDEVIILPQIITEFQISSNESKRVINTFNCDEDALDYYNTILKKYDYLKPNKE